MPIIKRYSNRKLYDSLTRRYVTLEEIGAMVQNGEDVSVIDHDSGADITAVTLTQVIFDQEKRMGGYLPQVIFSHVIKARDSSMSILRQGMDSLLDPNGHFNKEIQRRLDILHTEGLLADPDYSRLVALLLDKRFEEVVEQDSSPDSASQLETLQAQLHQMENDLEMIKRNRQSGASS
jgi:polyhydroxyalkanoate synthesis repressor PhaR